MSQKLVKQAKGKELRYSVRPGKIKKEADFPWVLLGLRRACSSALFSWAKSD